MAAGGGEGALRGQMMRAWEGQRRPEADRGDGGSDGGELWERTAWDCDICK